MGLREIKAALRRLENEGSDKDVRRLILAVPYKRGRAPERAEIIKYIAENRGETVAEVKEAFAGWTPGVLIRGEAHDWHPAEADLGLISARDGFEHAGEIVYPRPDELRWNEAEIIDDNMELHPLDRWQEAVNGILYGTPRGSFVYFESERSNRY